MAGANIWVVTTASGDVYESFNSPEAAAKFALREMAGFWRVQKEVFGDDLPDCPLDWHVAQDILAAKTTDASWDRYQIKHYSIDSPEPRQVI